ncbi:hypothetical protein LTR17_000082 [Elasticomyces elasticus]|nr:hypothetical protein LTR17_000082 [Elasticomyces elasticus]
MPVVIDDAAAAVAFVGLGFQCLAGCITGYQLISTALQSGRLASTFRCALLMEETRLLLWAKRSGLSEQRADPRLPWQAIKEGLANLQELLTNFDKLRDRYKFDVKVPDDTTLGKDPVQEQHKRIADDDFSFLTSPELTAERIKVLERAFAMQSWKHVGAHKKFWFAAVDKDKFRELLQDIGSIVDKLNAYLSDQLQDDMIEAQHRQQLQAIETACKVDELKTMLEANSLRNLLHLPETSAALLRFIQISDQAGPDAKELETLIAQTMQTSHNTLEEIVLKEVKVQAILGSDKMTGLADYRDVLFWIEWKKYEFGTEQERVMIRDSIAKLALLLNAPKHKSFRTLECFGKVDDNQGRLQLARQLGRSLHLLHTAGWMHKALSSHTIIFPPLTEAFPRSLDDPNIVGFAYSRPDQEGHPSIPLSGNAATNIYRHPGCFLAKSSYRKQYDIYSLGLILLEIAKWRPLSEIYLKISTENYLKQTKKNKKDLKPEERENIANTCGAAEVKHMREVLQGKSATESYLNDISFRAGSLYADVVLFCLSTKLDEMARKDNQATYDRTLTEAFLERVLRPLEECRV